MTFAHARRVENGEMHFVKHSDGTWVPDSKTYDIFDEVKAFKAQMTVSAAGHDNSQLKYLRDSRRTDNERAKYLIVHGYKDRNLVSTNVTYLYNQPPGTLVTPDQTHPYVFGRVHK